MTEMILGESSMSGFKSMTPQLKVPGSSSSSASSAKRRLLKEDMLQLKPEAGTWHNRSVELNGSLLIINKNNKLQLAISLPMCEYIKLNG